jgi:hypothetical protein
MFMVSHFPAVPNSQASLGKSSRSMAALAAGRLTAHRDKRHVRLHHERYPGFFWFHVH